jgi:5-dehydro-2-deoxygluconokinase
MRNTTSFAPKRRLDVICLGRLAVDLYAQQIGARLEDVSSFAKYLGGSSANVAFGTARLGLKSAMLSRVGADHMGQFLIESLQVEGCDVSQIQTDPDRLTALVLLGIKDRDTFPLIFYRENCADMALEATVIREDFIASAKALAITGTHFSTPGVHRASSLALDYAHRNNVRTVLDIDYRPVLWGLTKKGDGETRYVAAERVTQHLLGILPRFDLVVGTEEEFMIAGGGADLVGSLRAVRSVSSAVLVVKRGALGCAVLEADIPDTLEQAFNFCGQQVEVLNVLGAGDAFMSGFLKGWLNNDDYTTCCRYANACGALVVSRHACAPAMPSPAELEYFLVNAERLSRPDNDEGLARLHRSTVAHKQWRQLFVFAFDHRSQFSDMAREVGVTEARIPRLKRLLLDVVTETEARLGLHGRIGLLADDRFGQEVLNEATGRGWWIGRPVERPATNPLQFDQGPSIGSHLLTWPKEHVIKCLVQLHPDDNANLSQNLAQIQALYEAAQMSGHDLLLEIIPAKHLPVQPDTVLRAMTLLCDMGIYPEWWKLEAMSAAQWRAIEALIEERDPNCRGVLLLGLDAPLAELSATFVEARASRVCRGFAVGRTIFRELSRQWLAEEISDQDLVLKARGNFEALIRAWQQS